MEKAKNETAQEPVAEKAPELTQHDMAGSIVTRYSLWSMGAGFIPLPGIDIATVAGFQMKMLSDMSAVYNVPFSENAAKSIVAALTGSLSAGYIAKSYFATYIKSIPVIGFLGSVSMPIMSGAVTWAIGKVFMKHFDEGGTFLTFDVEKMKAHFRKLYEQGKSAVTSLKPAKA